MAGEGNADASRIPHPASRLSNARAHAA